MSLADKIMKITAPDNVAQHPLCMGGFSVAQQEAGKLANEADELMAEMAEALVALRHEMMESGNYHAGDFGWPDAKQKTNAAIERYNTYKERNNE